MMSQTKILTSSNKHQTTIYDIPENKTKYNDTV